MSSVYMFRRFMLHVVGVSIFAGIAFAIGCAMAPGIRIELLSVYLIGIRGQDVVASHQLRDSALWLVDAIPFVWTLVGGLIGYCLAASFLNCVDNVAA